MVVEPGGPAGAKGPVANWPVSKVRLEDLQRPTPTPPQPPSPTPDEHALIRSEQAQVSAALGQMNRNA